MPIDISIVVIVYSMPRQAMNTLYSLSSLYQNKVDSNCYEVIVIENLSDNNLIKEEVENFGHNFHYHPRRETGVSPAAAINEGLSLCQGNIIGLMIDGARMLSPGVLQQVIRANQISQHPMVVVPSYDLGEDLQQNSHLTGHNEHLESELLHRIDWRSNGYNLFDIAVPSEANINGYLNPIMECTCLFAPSSAWKAIKGADERFQAPGGGSLNLHIYRSMGLLPGSELFVLPGEGAFHQFHGGVTTDAKNGVAEKASNFREELNSYWGGHFHGLRRQPKILGSIPPQAMPHYQHACKCSINRLTRFKHQQKHPWPDEPEAEQQSPPYTY